MKRIVKILTAMLCITLSLVLSGCTDSSKDAYSEKPAQKQDPVVTISVEGFGDMKFRLSYENAPITVENFVTLAKEGFYDGLTFHRIIEDFMIQGGDPKGDGTGGSEKKIKGEFSANGVDNKVSHKRGVISMARAKSMNSASSQFFICTEDSDFLDGQYAAFGELIEGEEVLSAIASVDVLVNPYSGEKSTPLTPPVIKTITVAE